MFNEIDSWTWLWKLTGWGLLLWLGHCALVAASPRWRTGLWRLGAVGCLWIFTLAMLPPALEWKIDHTTVSTPVAVPESPPPITMSIADSNAATDATPSRPSPPLPPSSALPPERLRQTLSRAAASPVAKTVATPTPLLQQAPAVSSTSSAANWRFKALALGYLSGILLMATRIVRGVVQSNRLVQRATPAPAFVVEMAKDLANRLQVSVPIIRVSSEIAVPAVARWRRPCILIPHGMLSDPTNAMDLRAGLAHELSHIAGHDLLWDRVICFFRMLLWWHPCYWRMPEAHRAMCERVCDLTAAGLLNDRESYRESLARIALNVLKPRQPSLLGMASRPEILDRLQLLASGAQAPFLGRRGWILGAGSLLLACGIGSFSIRWNPIFAQAPAAQIPATSPAENEQAELPPFVLTVVKDEDGTPLADAEVRFWYHVKLVKHFKTDEQGRILMEWPPPEHRELMLNVPFAFIARHSGRVPYYAQIGVVSLDNLPKEKTIRMQSGVLIGGVVEDDDGNPVSGADASILVPATDTPSSIHYQILDMKTGDDGRWVLDGAPEPVESLMLQIDHPRYLKSHHPVQAGTEIRYRMERGWTVRGAVTDMDGNPIEKANVHVGHDRFGSGRPSAQTDVEGKYELIGLEEADTIITVTAEKHAPQIQNIKYSEGPAAADFRLEPGRRLTVTVVDPAGKPIPKASIAPDTWRGHRSLEWQIITDENGEARWSGAPADGVTFSIQKYGYSSNRSLTLIARDEPYVVTLQPIRTFEIAVLDASTLQPVPEMTAKFGSTLPGQNKTYWMDYSGFSGRRGKLSMTNREMQNPLFIRIDAPGYEPWISDALPVDVTKLEFQVLLKPGAGPAGLVLTPDGIPASNAQIHVITGRNGMQFSSGFRPHGGAQHVNADGSGRFQLQALDDPAKPALLAIVHASGYLEAAVSDLNANEPLKLERWGRIEVTLRDGDEPLPGETAVVSAKHNPQRSLQIFSYGIQAKANADGLAIIERCPPFQGSIGPQLSIAMPNGGFTTMMASVQNFQLLPGETLRLTLGASGRGLTGKIVVPPNSPEPHRWAVNEFGRLSVDGVGYDDPQMKYHGFKVGEDGAFRIPGVAPGKYQFHLVLNGEPNPALCGPGANIGEIRRLIEVPEGTGDFDLGEIHGEWTDYLLAGKEAPDFVTFDQDRKIVRLSDFRGKLVILDFWAMWCGPCVAELPLLEEFKAAQERRKDLPIEFLAVNCDQDFASAVAMAGKTGNRWRQLHGGSAQGEIPNAFDVQSFPVKFLIGPDGTVLYRGNDLQELSAILDKVESALSSPSSEASSVEKLTPEWIAALLKENLSPPDQPGLRSQPVEQDDFLPGADVDVLWGLAVPYDRNGHVDDGILTGLQFAAADGQLLRSMPELAPSGWLTRDDQIAVDRGRGRIYAVSHDIQTGMTKLNGFARNGRRLFHLDIPHARSIAVDEKTGDIWCLLLLNLNAGHVLILDRNGNEKSRLPELGFTLRYSPAADGFWLVGKTARLLDRNGTIRATASFPDGAYTFSAVAVDGEGGCWAIETSHPDFPGSKSCLWHFDQQGQLLARVEYVLDRAGNLSDFPTWLEVVGDEVWAGVAHVSDPKDLLAPKQEIRRYSRDGALLGELALPARAGATSGDGQSIWLLLPNQAMQVNRQGQELRSISTSAPALPAGVYQPAWLLAF